MDAVVGEAVGRAGAEVEQRVAAEHVDHESVRMHGIDHERRAADQRLERGRDAAGRRDGVLWLEKDIGLHADDAAEQVSHPDAAPDLVGEPERGIVARVGAERAYFDLSGVLRGKTSRGERQHGGQQPEPSHVSSRAERAQGNWCSSTRRFCARPAAVVLAAIGLAAPYPFATMRLGATPLLPRYARTASARACDSLRLVALEPVLSV